MPRDYRLTQKQAIKQAGKKRRVVHIQEPKVVAPVNRQERQTPAARRRDLRPQRHLTPGPAQMPAPTSPAVRRVLRRGHIVSKHEHVEVQKYLAGVDNILAAERHVAIRNYQKATGDPARLKLTKKGYVLQSPKHEHYFMLDPSSASFVSERAARSRQHYRDQPWGTKPVNVWHTALETIGLATGAGAAKVGIEKIGARLAPKVASRIGLAKFLAGPGRAIVRNPEARSFVAKETAAALRTSAEGFGKKTALGKALSLGRLGKAGTKRVFTGGIKAGFGLQAIPAVGGGGLQEFGKPLHGQGILANATLGRAAHGKGVLGLIPNMAKDIYGLPAATIPSTYLLAAAVVAKIKGDGKPLSDLWNQWRATDAIGGIFQGNVGDFWKRFQEHPLYPVLEAYGLGSAAGIGASAGLRSGYLGPRAKEYASREYSLPAGGGELNKDRLMLSKNLPVTRYQKWLLKTGKRGMWKHRHGDTLTRIERNAREWRQHRIRSTIRDTEQYSAGRAHRERAATQRLVADTIIQLGKTVPHETIPVVTMAIERIVRREDPLADLTHTRAMYEHAYPYLHDDAALNNRARVAAIDHVVAHPEELPRIFEAADAFVRAQRPAELEQIRRGILNGEQAIRARGRPEEVIHQGGRMLTKEQQRERVAALIDEDRTLVNAARADVKRAESAALKARENERVARAKVNAGGQKRPKRLRGSRRAKGKLQKRDEQVFKAAGLAHEKRLALTEARNALGEAQRRQSQTKRRIQKGQLKKPRFETVVPHATEQTKVAFPEDTRLRPGESIRDAAARQPAGPRVAATREEVRAQQAEAFGPAPAPDIHGVFAMDRPGGSYTDPLARLIEATDANLSTEARMSLNSWLLSAERGMDPKIAAELHRAFEPVREKLRQRYGETVRLYRGQTLSVDKERVGRELLSFTSDKTLAEAHAEGKINGHLLEMDVPVDRITAITAGTETPYSEFFVRVTPDEAASLIRGERSLPWAEEEGAVPALEFKGNPETAVPAAEDRGAGFLSQRPRGDYSSLRTGAEESIAEPGIPNDKRSGVSSLTGAAPADIYRMYESLLIAPTRIQEHADFHDFGQRAFATGRIEAATHQEALRLAANDQGLRDRLGIPDDAKRPFVAINLDASRIVANADRALIEQLGSEEGLDPHAINIVTQGVWDAALPEAGLEGRWTVAGREQYNIAREQRAAIDRPDAANLIAMWKRAILPYSPSWYLGNYFDISIRALTTGQPPPGFDRFTARYRLGKHYLGDTTADPLAAKYGVATGSQFGTSGAGPSQVFMGKMRRDLNPRSKRLGKAVQAFRDAPGPRQVMDAYIKSSDWLFHANTLLTEESPFVAGLGKVALESLREHVGLWHEAVRAGKAAHEDLLKGFRETPTQAAYAERVQRTFGNWLSMSPRERRTLAYYMPFYMWLRAASKFVFVTLPRDHPILTGMAAMTAQATRPEREILGLDMWAKNPVADYQQGSIPANGKLMRTANLTSFGVWSGGFTSLAHFLVPQFSALIYGGAGVDFTGKQFLVDGKTPDPAQVAAIVGYLTAESWVPGLPLIRRISARGRYEPVPWLERKGKKKSLKQAASEAFVPILKRGTPQKRGGGPRGSTGGGGGGTGRIKSSGGSGRVSGGGGSGRVSG